MHVLCKLLAGARNKYEYERCIASASAHYISFPIKETDCSDVHGQVKRHARVTHETLVSKVESKRALTE